VVPHNRPGYPELPSGEPFDAVKAAGLFCESEVAAGIAAELRPKPEEPVVAKCRYSPFFANDLLHLLHMADVQTLVLAGIATSGVVLSAVRDAWDRDYKIVVLGDACADPNAKTEQVLLDEVIAKQAIICSVDSWIDSAAGPGAG
jgi:nicotinamidase-related amidase